MPSVLFLTQSGPTLPSVRFRVLPFIEHGRGRGYSVDFRRIPKSIVERIPFLLMLRHSDTIVIQKKLFSQFELKLLRKKCHNLVFDFDDALWTFHPSEPPGRARDKRVAKIRKRFEMVCPSVDLVIAGNKYLADNAAPLQPNIQIIPTPIDTDIYVPAERKGPTARPTVGWMGTASNLYFLPEVFTALNPYADRLHFCVIADKRFSEKYKTAADFEFWQPEKEVAQLQAMDIGLMPLTDDDYTRGKCGFKILQYMACGVAPVASNVGFNREIIEHGKDGFLVDRPEQWAEYVLLLAEKPELRARMAAAGREKVVRDFSLTALADRFWKALKM